MKTKKICPTCGKEFYTDTNAKKYCSKKCQKKLVIKKEPMRKCTCAWCGAVFTTPRRRTYCTEECRLFANGKTRESRKPKPKKPLFSLEQVARMAKEAGLTYGMYVQKNNL
jgi:predicted nucleic acid-binding Zn ribbon protein